MLILCTALIAAVPPVTLGPDSALRATAVDAPITRVVVFEDRARVVRRATVDVSAGATTVRLPDLPGLTDVGALRATVSGAARLLRLEAAPVDRDRLRLEPAAALLDRLDALDDGLRRLELDRQAAVTRGQLWAALAPAPALGEAQREGRPAPGVFAEAWTKVAAALGAERQALAARVAALDLELRKAHAQRQEVAAELGRLDLGGLTERVVEVLVVLDAASAGKAVVELEYFVPGARWRPTYELRFYADEGRAELAAYGLVTQASGEDWTDVQLELSTALPSFEIALPKLMTWTLGEAKEWRPTVYPRSAVPVTPSYPPPVPGVSRADETRAVERTLLLSRVGTTLQRRTSYDFDDATVVGDLVAPDGAATGAASRAAPAAPAMPPPPPPAPPPMSRPSPRIQTKELAMEMDMAAPTAADSAEYEESVASAPGSGGVRALSLFERPPPAPAWVDPSSPAALAGGLDHVYVAAARATVTSGAEAYRAPLTREAHPVTAFYEATPALAPQAYLRATVTNRSALPILGGPVGIYLGTAYAGDGALATTGAGGTLALPLGGDEDVKVSRKVLLETERKGVFSKDDVTTYRVQLEVASYKRRAVKVVVREPLPISEHEDVEVKLLGTMPKTAAPEEDGVVTWTVEVAPGKVAKLELTYQIKRPADFQLYQR